MAKKLRFTGIDSKVLANINAILETQFVQIEAVADLNKTIKACDIRIEDIDRAITEGAEGQELEKLNAQREAEVTKKTQAENRRKGIADYANPLLFGRKGKTERVEGLYQQVLKVQGQSFYGYYLEAIDRQSLNDTKHAIGFKSAMSSLIKDTFGMGETPDALLNKFVNWMTVINVPVQVASGRQIVKGELLKPLAEKSYNRTLLMAMVDYMNKKGGLDIVVPTKSEYDYEVTYDEGCHPVTFKMVLKSEDQKKTEAEAEEKAKAEKKEQAKKRREAKKAENKAA